MGTLNKQKIIIITKIKLQVKYTICPIQGDEQGGQSHVCYRTVTGGQSTQKAATQAQLQHLNSTQERPARPAGSSSKATCC